MYTYIYVYMYVCMHACMHACMYVCMYVYKCMPACMHTDVCKHSFQHKRTDAVPQTPVHEPNQILRRAGFGKHWVKPASGQFAADAGSADTVDGTGIRKIRGTEHGPKMIGSLI